MRITVTGAKDLYRLAAAMHDAGRGDLKRELDRGSNEAGQVLVAEVERSMNDYIPRQFEQRWDQSFQTKVEVRLVSGRRITVVFWATGKRERRDIKAINAGRLRHPVYGRNRRLKNGELMANPWVMQPIRPGLVDEPARRAMPRAVKKIDDAVERVVLKIDKAG